MTDLMPFPRAGFRPLLKRIAADDAGVEAADVSGAALGPDFAAALAAALRGNTHVTRVDARGAFLGRATLAAPEAAWGLFEGFSAMPRPGRLALKKKYHE